MFLFISSSPFEDFIYDLYSVDSFVDISAFKQYDCDISKSIDINQFAANFRNFIYFIFNLW